MIIRVIFLMCWCCSFRVEGQKTYTLSFLNADYSKVKKHPNTAFKSDREIKSYLSNLQLLAYKKGYLLASVDTIYIDEEMHYSVDFSVGPQFHEAQLTMDAQELRFLKTKGRIAERTLAKLPISPVEFTRMMSSVKRVYLNNGYPFATVYLDSVVMLPHSLSAVLSVDRGPQLHWSKLHLRGDSTMSERLIANLFQIKIGKNYNETVFEQLPQAIQQIHFLEEMQPSQTLFTTQGVELYTYLKSKPASSVNGIIGLQPNTTTSKLSLTGEIALELQNVLKRAEKLNIDWKGLEQQTQELKAQLHYPYIFNTPFGLGGEFELHKSDSTFLELSSQLSVDYYFSFNHFISAFYQASSSNLLSGAETSSIDNLGSVKARSYGLSLSIYTVDYRPNPKTGWAVLMQFSVGTRSSQVSDTASIDNHTAYRSMLSVSRFISLTQRNVLMLRNQTNVYHAPLIFANEAFRYGGLNTQRGFDEQELHSTARTTFSVEWRFLTDKNSFIFLFFDQSWYENRSQNYYRDIPYGFGAGFSFTTPLGIFSLTYALGKQFNNPLLIRDAKLHFGYSAYF